MKLLLPVFLFLTSCMTPAKFTQELYQRWNGKHIDEAVMQYGQPTSITPLEQGRKMYEWKKNAGATAIASSNYGVTTVNANNKYCNIRLSTEPTGVIKVVNWDGNACFDPL